MENWFNRVSQQISSFYISLTMAKRVTLLLTAATVVGAIVYLTTIAGDKIYQPLFSNLSSEDSAQVLKYLGEKKVNYRIDATGKNISVPPDLVDQTRLELATLGVPSSGSVGYEIFDKQSLATTSAVQKMNQKRALEGELMKTIGSIKGVKRSRVHLAIPQKSTFVEDQKKTTASVVIDLLPGVALQERQIFGISYLVARAVEGMDPVDVVITDGNGKLLSKNQSDSLAQASMNQLEFRTKVEGDLERRIEEMLARVVGEGKVVARVSADVDFAQVNETQTIFDQDGSAVRSVQEDTRTQEGSRPVAQGAAGSASNLPNQEPKTQTGAMKTATNFNNKTVNYEVPQTIRKTLKPQGDIRKLSVAVVVDRKAIKSTDAEGNTKTEMQAWSAENIKEFEAIIVSAAGIDRKRGDTLEIKNLEFSRVDYEEAGQFMAAAEKKALIENAVKYGVMAVTIVLFFMFVVRPFIRWLTENTSDGVETYLPQTIEELEKINLKGTLPGLEDIIPKSGDLDPEKLESNVMRERITKLINANPQKAALILRDWLHQTGGMPAKQSGGEKGKAASA
jgi:flagellar M-ring protein FliF